MQVEVLMPKMGESITEGKIVKWHKKPGDNVERDEILLEISTDKVDTEIPSSAAGILSRIVVQEQDTVAVGSVIAYIDTEASAGAYVASTKSPNEPEVQERELVAEEPGAMPSSAGAAYREVTHGQNGNKFYSPLVRSIARAEGISADELTSLDGSGAGGRITKEDVKRYIENRGHHATTGRQPIRRQAVPAAAVSIHDSKRETIIPMDNMRQRIMDHMVTSRDTSVHVAAITEVDMTKIADSIALRGKDFEKSEGFKLTFMPFIAQSCVKALKDFPLVNSTIDGNKIVQHNYVNMGIAVAIETTGLLVPVVKGADEKNITGLARAIRDLALRARTKRLTGDDIIGSTFSITNYGVFGNLMGTPIINQPNVAILGVGAVKKRPVVINDAIAIRQMGFLTLSFDHRLVDGALGGQFLERIVYYLESFDTEQAF
jgi:2-oxoglutarate dehydrogenase complex dihydrolipoamide succinyltransferase (E2) component